jgi:CheY-like chemotaxis protein
VPGDENDGDGGQPGGAGPAQPEDAGFGRLAHRLNNATTAILTSLELIAEELGAEPPGDGNDRKRRLVGEAIAGVDRLTEIVRDLRGLSWGSRSPAEPQTDPGDHDAVVARRVLVVDDDPFLLSGIAQVLDQDEVVPVESGADALALLARDTAFDVLLCDLVMEGGGGIEVHRWLSQHQPALAERTIFMTAGAFTAEAREFLAHITNPILRKPFDTRTLRWIVSQSARRRPKPGTP